jgi:hypothetical protein
MRLVLWLGLQPRSNFRCRHPSLRTLLRGAFRHSRELTANCGLGRKSRNFGGLKRGSRIMPVIPIGPDSLAGAFEVLIDLVADANSPDRGKPVFGSEGAHADGDLPGAHALALHGSGFEVDVMDGLRVHAETSVIPAAGHSEIQQKKSQACRA